MNTLISKAFNAVFTLMTVAAGLALLALPVGFIITLLTA